MKLRDGIYYSDFYLSNGKRVRKSLDTREKSQAGKLEKALQLQLEAQLQGIAKSPVEASRKPTAGHHSSTQAHTSGMTLEAAYRRCMREHEPWRASTSKDTIEANYGHVSKHFKPHKDLAELTRDDMLEYVEKLRDEEELSGSTINQRLSLLNVLMTHAEAWTKGAVKVFKMPRQKVRSGRIRILSYDEEFKVIQFFLTSKRSRGHDHDMADLVKFLVDTGFRLSEALRLRSDEVDWDLGMVPAWETKADHPRFVPMTKRVREVMEEREKLDRPFEMFSVDSADDHWEKMRVELKIDPKKDPEFVLHALRHTCASRLCASGMDAFRVQKWMGHKNIQTTQKYVTLYGSDLKDLALALDSRRTDAALKVPFYGPSGVPKGVPKRVSKKDSGSHIRIPRELYERLAAQGSRPINEPEHTVGEGLLIRRSLVRAQVGEPNSSDVSDEVDTNTTEDCDQKCDQR